MKARVPSALVEWDESVLFALYTKLLAKKTISYEVLRFDRRKGGTPVLIT